jgi:CDP-diacylglycerol---serine O-phosphatidyltransferase
MKQWRRNRPRRNRLKGLSFNMLVPNLITVMALCSGLSGLRFALAEKWEFAVGFVLLAAIFDALDGRMARLLRAQSKFGAELDSLSDFVCFGVVPACILFLWSMQNIQNYGWMVVLSFATCAALRLARFNVKLEDDKPAFAYNYFTGVPAPAGAGAALLPMILDFQLEPGLQDLPVLIAIWTVGIGLLMVSQVPTYSFKKMRIPQRLVLPVLIGCGLLVAALVSAPWITLAVVIMVYLATIPMSFLSYRRLLDAAETLAQERESEDQSDTDSRPET